MSTDLGIRRAGPADTPMVSSLLAAALMDTDVATWLVPDRRERVHIYRNYFALVTPWFVEHGTVYLTDDGGAAATWASVQHGPFAPDIADYDTRLAHACGTATGRFVQLDLAMHDAHPGQVPHEYLAFLGVDRDTRNAGIGNALLAHHHRHLDQAGTPAYLEATGERNAKLYARNGYQLGTPYPIADGPPLHPMWRDPHPQ
jgi:ribosomal protein S18 acetylase RimI-like enzyme